MCTRRTWRYGGTASTATASPRWGWAGRRLGSPVSARCAGTGSSRRSMPSATTRSSRSSMRTAPSKATSTSSSAAFSSHGTRCARTSARRCRSGDDVGELAALLVLEDQLATAVWHRFFLDDRLAVVRSRGSRNARNPRSAPVIKADRLPRPAIRRPVAGVDDRVDDVAVVERLHRLPAFVHRREHVREHVDVAELTDLVTDGEEPTAGGLGLLGDVVT